MTEPTDPTLLAQAFRQMYSAAMKVDEVLDRNDVLNLTVPPEKWPLRQSADEFAFECQRMAEHYEAMAAQDAKLMTFEQFQATRTECADLGKALSDAMWDNDPERPRGLLYCETLWIAEVMPHWPEPARAQGKWYLLLHNMEWISDNLEELERRLYDFAKAAGYCDPQGKGAA